MHIPLLPLMTYLAQWHRAMRMKKSPCSKKGKNGPVKEYK